MASLSQLPLLGCFHPTAETMFLHSSPAYDLLYHFSLNPLCRYPFRVYDYLNVKPLIDPTLTLYSSTGFRKEYVIEITSQSLRTHNCFGESALP